MNKAILTPHSRAIYSASISREGFNWLHKPELENSSICHTYYTSIAPYRRIIKKAKQIRALVVTLTRELAVQIGQSFDTYGKYTNLTQLTIFGGVSQNPQVDALRNGVDILIATPGRLLDLHKQGFIDLDHLHALVLDEADQMLDMGFVNDVKKS
jgi:superfamily II DNA/RNA helicase